MYKESWGIRKQPRKCKVGKKEKKKPGMTVRISKSEMWETWFLLFFDFAITFTPILYPVLLSNWGCSGSLRMTI